MLKLPKREKKGFKTKIGGGEVQLRAFRGFTTKQKLKKDIKKL